MLNTPNSSELRVLIDAPKYFIRPRNTDWRYMCSLEGLPHYGGPTALLDTNPMRVLSKSASYILARSGRSVEGYSHPLISSKLIQKKNFRRPQSRYPSADQRHGNSGRLAVWHDRSENAGILRGLWENLGKDPAEICQIFQSCGPHDQCYRSSGYAKLRYVSSICRIICGGAVFFAGNIGHFGARGARETKRSRPSAIHLRRQ